MNREINRSKRVRVFEILMIAATCITFCAVLVLSFTAVKNLSGCYRELVSADLTKDYSGRIYYDDRLHVVLGKGVVLDETATIADRPAIMSSFLKEALFYIDQRIFASGILYAMMISALALYPTMKRNMRMIWLIGPFVYVFYVVFEMLSHSLFSVPFYFPDGSGIVRILCELIAVSGGSCAVSLLLKRVKYQKHASMLIVPAVFILFLIGMYIEFGMYSPKTVDSFDYLYSMDSRILEEGYYDNGKNILIFEDKEYLPEQAENPEHYTGIKYLGASLYEILYPYSGSCLYMVEQATEHEVSLFVYVLYAVKGLIWIFFVKKDSDQKRS